MIKETGKVVKVEGDYIWVETEVTSTCDTCNAKANCGTSSIAKAFSSKTVINQVENVLNANEGDWVEIGVSEESLVKGAATMYMLPLISALTFAVVCQFFISRFITINEGHVVFSTILGAWLGFVVVKKQLSKQDKSLEPVLLAIKEQVIAVNVADEDS